MNNLQDINAWIKIIEAEKTKGLLYKVINRISVPLCMFKSTDEWLEILYLEKKLAEEKYGRKDIS